MKDLSVIREELDRLDRQLVRLFEQRMVISREVAQYKNSKGLPVLDEAREKQVIQSRRAMLTDPHWADDVEALFETVPDVDGAFCTNDLIASYVMQRAVQLGKRIPEDLKVIGFNDTYQASSTIPPLTSVRQPVPQMVERALSILMRQIRGEKVDLTTSLPVTLSKRGSTRGMTMQGV